jgi:hypothetical protein
VHSLSSRHCLTSNNCSVLSSFTSLICLVRSFLSISSCLFLPYCSLISIQSYLYSLFSFCILSILHLLFCPVCTVLLYIHFCSLLSFSDFIILTIQVLYCLFISNSCPDNGSTSCCRADTLHPMQLMQITNAITSNLVKLSVNGLCH